MMSNDLIATDLAALEDLAAHPLRFSDAWQEGGERRLRIGYSHETSKILHQARTMLRLANRGLADSDDGLTFTITRLGRVALAEARGAAIERARAGGDA